MYNKIVWCNRNNYIIRYILKAKSTTIFCVVFATALRSYAFYVYASSWALCFQSALSKAGRDTVWCGITSWSRFVCRLFTDARPCAQTKRRSRATYSATGNSDWKTNEFTHNTCTGLLNLNAISKYRYSFTSSADNCHLGDKLIRQLDIFQDLVPDRDSDVFVRNELSQPGCQPVRNWDTGENSYYNTIFVYNLRKLFI